MLNLFKHLIDFIEKNKTPKQVRGDVTWRSNNTCETRPTSE